MSYLIGTYAQCTAYNNKVVNSHNHTGITANWATPRKHPDRNEWAILKADTVKKIEGMTEVSKLPEGWQN